MPLIASSSLEQLTADGIYGQISLLDQPLLQSLFEDLEARPLTVSELNAEVRSLVERRFADVWVEGEVVDFKQYGSGHWYFTLNDGDAQIKCVCWRTANYRIRFRPENGITVRIRGRITFWEQKGELKLTVESLEPSGEGALRAAYEQIRARLEGQGLFADGLKRPIPFFPRRVGVVTSRSGAAFHDILTVLQRRARSVSVVLAPANVQGEGAADSIRRALIALNRYSRSCPPGECVDVVIVGRGGGSAEDLWAFNDEALARAIRASKIPVISAVGHEIDWTIADLIADLRAATPSAAAELVAAREEDIVTAFQSAELRLAALAERSVDDAAARLEALTDAFEGRFELLFERLRSRYEEASARLSPAALQSRAAAYGAKLELLDQKRDSCVIAAMKRRHELLGVNAAKLDALSPLAVLRRGYSIAQAEDGSIIRDASQASTGDLLKIRLERGKLNARVLSSDIGDV